MDATALCKAAGKKWNDYWRLDATREFIQALAESTGIPVDSIVEQRSGRGGGTWVHPDLALSLAQWLSPKFAVQVAKWVRELLTTGTINGRVGHPEVDMVTDLTRRVEQLAAAVESMKALPSPGSYPATPRFTVADRLRFKAWFTASSKQRATIRRLANALLYSRHDDTPDIIGGTSFYWGHQLACLDEAIDRVKQDAEQIEKGAAGARLPLTA